MTNYEYRTVVMPITGAWKKKLPDIESALNEAGADGWRFSQMEMHTTMGTADMVILVLERMVD